MVEAELGFLCKCIKLLQLSFVSFICFYSAYRISLPNFKSSFYGFVKLVIDITFIVSLRIDSCLALWLTLQENVFIVFKLSLMMKT